MFPRVRLLRCGSVGLGLVLAGCVQCASSFAQVAPGALPSSSSPAAKKLNAADAKRVNELNRTVEQLRRAGKFAEAIEPARDVLAIRQKALGKDHWRTDDARIRMEELQRIAELPEEGRKAMVSLSFLETQFTSLKDHGRILEAEALSRSIQEICVRWLGKNHPRTARSDCRVSTVLQSQHRYREAEQLGREALAKWLESMRKDHPDTVRFYNNLAITLYPQGKYAEAESMFRESLVILERLDWPDDMIMALALHNLAHVILLKERFAEAEPILRRALKICVKLKKVDAPESALFHQSLSMLLGLTGKYAEAEPLLRTQIAIWRKNRGDDHPDTLKACAGLAQNLDHQGRYADAEPLLRKALAGLIKSEGESRNTAFAYSFLAGNLYSQGKYPEAEFLCQKAVAITRKIEGDDSPFLASPSELLAAILDRQGRYKEAEPYCRKSMDINSRGFAGHAGHSGTSHYNSLAANLVGQKKHAEAESLLRKALEEAVRTGGEQSYESQFLSSNLAAVLNVQSKFREAELLLRELLAHLPKTGSQKDGDLLAIVYHQLALCLDDQGRVDEAVPKWIFAADIFEQRRRLRSATGLGRALKSDESPLAELAAALAHQGHGREAWARWENDLARGLLDDLSARNLRPLTQEEREREVNLAGQIQRLDERIAGLAAGAKSDSRAETQVDRLRNEQIALRGQWGELQNALDQKYQAYAGKPSSLEDIQKTLASKTALVGWLDLHQHHWACVVRHKGDPIWVKIPGSGKDGAWIKEDVDRPRELLDAIIHNDTFWEERAKELARQRIAPLLASLRGVERLVVLPSRNLAGVPVETLVAFSQPSDGSPMVVSYAPSGSIFARLIWARARETAPLRLLAVGDPAFPRPAKSEPASAPPSQGIAMRAEAELLKSGVRGEGLVPLPGTRREVLSIAALFPSGQVKMLLGVDATESNLQGLAQSGDLKGYRFIHLATHGKTNANVALSSNLFLAAEPEQPARAPADPAALESAYDGQVTAEQIVRSWDLDADLVVLSACESGLGRYVGGEGYLGFTQALFVKGARSVVLSLWKVDDRATALLMKRFYQNLLGKREDSQPPMPKAQALSDAKAWLRRQSSETDRINRSDPRYSLKGEAQPAATRFDHPYYWAGFILIGDPN
jgi:CHAT domain-containing protein/tetratricopeptide (TPR) repeat protein